MTRFYTIFLITQLFIFGLSSCNTTLQKQYYQDVKGTWAINEFQHRDLEKDSLIDLTWPERYFSLGFEKSNNLFFIKKENRNSKFIGATYKIFKENDTLKIQIENSDDLRLEGTYDLYLDTIEEAEMQYRVQLSLDSEKTYLSAQKWKNK